MLSKRWLSLWTSTPVLHLNYIAFRKLHAFDRFVDKVLRLRDQSVKLNTLTFARGGVSSAKILKDVLNYASPMALTTWNSSSTNPEAGAIIENDFKPFSGFPMLEKLVLNDCRLGGTLSVEATKLSDLTISCHHSILNRCELTTPNLRFFEFTGSNFPLLQTHDDLPLLEKAVIDFDGFRSRVLEKRNFDDLVTLLGALHNAKSVTLSFSTVDLLGLFSDKLEIVNSPFCGLKYLNLDLRYFLGRTIFEEPRRWSFEMPEVVKDYLLHKSREAKFTVIHPVRINMADTKTNIQENKEKRRRMIEDGRLRLDNLPKSLQFHNLTLLDTKKAVQISMLSKQWLPLWTSKPVLHLNCSDFRCVDDFDKFVNHVLRHRDHSAELNTLTFTRRGFSSRNFVKKVLDYAISHGVNHLKLSIKCFENDSCDIKSWNNCLHTSSNSLKTLKLKSQCRANEKSNLIANVSTTESVPCVLLSSY
ncbi:hypothetical protein OSB04_026806 [Centaurea solstitialis]|uniref:Uncharacterized protein n=1 Tax=Centaurea solstitialis TaxID=347529 RepID=A0AA38SCK4_9ASTR|nr:hypothetical protein OSB04_026806 [Centaurea solstitialis]